jgi:glycosyltransferase involved in cell wall biosynthesis
LKIAFVIPWYGKDAAGGAEAECRSLVHGLRDIRPDIQVDVLTTCLKEFAADWNSNVHSEGQTTEDGITVRRFAATREDRRLFHFLNAKFLMGNDVAPLWQGDKPRSPIWERIEKYYIRKMIRSHSMVRYIRTHYSEYDFFIFLPYMFGTTYFGALAAKDKAVIMPCLHNERYAYMNIYREMMEAAKASIFLVGAEQRLANRLCAIGNRPQFVLGAMLEGVGEAGTADNFRRKYEISGPFLLYAGRKVEGKNLPLLVERFMGLKISRADLKDLKLVIMGRGNLDYKKFESRGIVDLGFVSEEDKRDAMCAASVFCMPSLNESFSIVLMEGWLQGAPALVHSDCDVTKEHCELSGGGLWFSDQKSFDRGVMELLEDEGRRAVMGKKGREYVLANFTKEKVINRLIHILAELKQVV